MKSVGSAAAACLAGLLSAASASALPLQNTDSNQLLVDMTWGFGEFGTDVNLQFGADDKGGGFLKVSETSRGSRLSGTLVEGYVDLTDAEAKEFLTLEKEANFPSIPAYVDMPPDKDSKGDPIYYPLCGTLSISEIRQHDYKNVRSVERNHCEKREPVLMNYAKALVRAARKHFPDLASSDAWLNTLKEDEK
jgi:hypothetical protein